MLVINLWKDNVGSYLDNTNFDLCIIGSGPAGSTIAKELANTNLKIAIAESGDFDRRLESDALDLIENVGWPRVDDQWEVRNRIVGGSSHTWGGRCAPFDEIDFERRDWVPASGWPLEPREIQHYLDRSTDHIGLSPGNGFRDEATWMSSRDRAYLDVGLDGLLPFCWQYSRDASPTYAFEYTRFGRHLVKHLGPHQTLIAGATLIQVETTGNADVVKSLLFKTPSGGDLRLRTKAVVLCAGGIENARILLNSNAVAPKGLGNRHDLVGRYLMDHIRGPVGRFALTDSAEVLKRFGRINANGNLFTLGMRLSPEIQRREHLLNCATWIGEQVAEDDPWTALRNLLQMNPRTMPRELLSVLKGSRLLANGMASHLFGKKMLPRKLDELTLVAMVEQLPDRDSRVTLSDKRDALGIPKARVDWRAHPEEALSMRRIAELATDRFRAMGIPGLVLEEWVRNKEMFPRTFVDVAHPSTTTRMSAREDEGVVDPDCKVYGVEGLYVAGSSVFPTVGHCNPTQLIVALSIRLADLLRTSLPGHRPIVSTPYAPAKAPFAKADIGSAQNDASTRGPGPKVLVTGARGRLGIAVLPDLLQRGYSVRAVTSGKPPEGRSADGRVEWRQFDLIGEEGYADLVAGCDAVVHLAAELGKIEIMQRVNERSTGLLAKAAEEAGIASFSYVSTVSVYGSSIARDVVEDGPVLTNETDVAAEYWALPYVRAYGRTKLRGELELRRYARQTNYIILRPTRIVSIDELIEIREWSKSKRLFAAHRNAQHIYNADVSDAIVWSIERGLRDTSDRGKVEVFNLSDCDFNMPRHVDFMQKAYLVSKDERFKVAVIPSIIDWLRDFAKYGRRLPVRRPLWSMRFPNQKIRDAGYSLRYGMAHAHALALERLRAERDGRC